MLVRNKTYGNVYWVDAMHSTPYKIDNYCYNLFDLISSLVNENNDYSLICGHIRRGYNIRSEDPK